MPRETVLKTVLAGFNRQLRRDVRTKPIGHVFNRSIGSLGHIFGHLDPKYYQEALSLQLDLYYENWRVPPLWQFVRSFFHIVLILDFRRFQQRVES